MLSLFSTCRISIQFHNFSQIRFLHKNHYEILNLKKDCTKDEIRTAFIGLSKKHHPDRPESKNFSVKYVDVLEAYKVLIDPKTRADYDLSLGNPNQSSHYRTYQYYYDPYQTRQRWDNPYYYAKKHQRKPYTDEEHQRTMRELMKLFWFPFITLMIIYLLTMWYIHLAYGMKIERQQVRNSAILRNVQNQANEHGNEKQLEILLSKLSEK